jgi:hypothetical protein
MFMLNLLFDFNSPDGVFSEKTTLGVPLLNSKHWLHIPPPDLPGTFDPENLPSGLAWQDLGPVGTLYIPPGGMAGGQHIAVRIAPDPIAGIANNAAGWFVAAFGRPVIARQKFASPFVDSGQTKTIVNRELKATERPNGGNTGWFVRLGTITRTPVHVNLTDRYEFSLGVDITSGGVLRSYGEDPEFDVGG